MPLSTHDHNINIYIFQTHTGDDSNNGTSVSSAFETTDTAIDALSPGDTLMIVGELTNPSYDPNYTFDGNVSDPQLWHSENTIKINNLEGTADAWISIIPYDETTVIGGDGSNIIRVSNSAYLRFINLTLIGEVLNIPYSTAKAMQFVYKDDNGTIRYRIDPTKN